MEVVPMKYVVTGGAGFIGSNLVDELVAGGHKVCIIDDFSEGKNENLPKTTNAYSVRIFIFFKFIIF